MKHRLELFSDAVMAIIITIMVLDLRTPGDGGWQGFKPLFVPILVYMAGFLVLAAGWVYHHEMFARVERINRTILWANFGFLFVLSLVPLVIRGIAEHPRTPANAMAFILLAYIGIHCLTIFRFASKSQNKGNPEFLAWNRRRTRTSLIGIPVFLILMAVMYFSVPVGLLLYVVVTAWTMSTMMKT